MRLKSGHKPVANQNHVKGVNKMNRIINYNLKYDVGGNVYEIVSTADNKVWLQNVNNDSHIEMPYEKFETLLSNGTVYPIIAE